MGRAAASRAGGTADALDELDFHWGSGATGNAVPGQRPS